ncbi:5-methyltetrahydropteroyltriglutamate--homocysteine S-methyltransferase [Paraflavisolibacter sp. H34]|uniref:5-methyltetrahydropteroyltriglutamate-- homocysteine S-methyltransferase n=1 Tax=Huijunlia imazamoxiresistens TaxID=3127457 RepID=UPI003018C6C5
MQTHNLGYPRIGNRRELKKACEAYWAGTLNDQQLEEAAAALRRQNWQTQQEAGIDLLPCNDFSFYDHVLDTVLMTGAVPDRFLLLQEQRQLSPTDLLFALARGYQKDGFDLTALEMTKWFDTNYHYLVPEFTAGQQFSLNAAKVVREYAEAVALGVAAKPVLLGPVSFLLLGKEKEDGFHRLELLDRLLPVYIELLTQLSAAGAHYLQFDEPCLSLDLDERERAAFAKVYTTLHRCFPQLHFLLASYFDCYGSNLPLALSLPVQTLHLDLVRCPAQLDDILAAGFAHSATQLSLGVVDGRNIWINDFEQSLTSIRRAVEHLGADRLWIAPSCSLLHVPCDLELESNEKTLPAEVKSWLAFAKQKLEEVVTLKQLAAGDDNARARERWRANAAANKSRRTSPLTRNAAVRQRVAGLTPQDDRRRSAFAVRRPLQHEALRLPLFPTTTIGSFPQTAEVRSWRAQWKKGALSAEEYDRRIARETENAIRWQEEIGLDVLVHGEFERNDMVEYFGEQLAGFAFTQNGWVQSYGSRCVKPPVIYGDVRRPAPMTVKWSAYAQSLAARPVKGMLTGPVTMLQWSFVRNDQPRAETCTQIALAIRDEVADLERAGIRVIQIDEPALREGLPLRQENRRPYLQWAVKAFRIAASGVQDETQVHTHMCYSEFNDIIDSIAAMDADVITIECSRSQMELLDAFADFRYPNEIGPGVYDIHAPRIPSVGEMEALLIKALQVLPPGNLWVNPDCGLKTRSWEETRPALVNMVKAARKMRALLKDKVHS